MKINEKLCPIILILLINQYVVKDVLRAFEARMSTELFVSNYRR